MDPSQRRRRHSSSHFLITTFSPPSTTTTTTTTFSPPSTTTTTTTEPDFSESDLFFTSPILSPPTTTTTRPKPPPLRTQRSFKLDLPSPSGILAALPLPSPQPSSRTISILPHPNSLYPSSELRHTFSLPSHHLIPTRRVGACGFDDIQEDGDDDVMMPPHEMVARRLRETPVLSCSVLEGAGRTLKGRDLRQVRNAVFRQTGFID